MTFTPKQFEINAAIDHALANSGSVYGLTPIPSPPKCEHHTRHRPSRIRRCPQTATWQAADGGKFCRIHALQWAEAHDA